MAKADITAARLRELFTYNLETGTFVRLKSVTNNTKAGDVAKCKNSYGYIVFRVDGSLLMAHRAAWLYVTGEWPKKFVDHIDGDKTNNRFRNLRDVSQSINMQNEKRPRRGNSTGFLGVSNSFGKFAATLSISGKTIYLGRFATPDEAHAAYLEAKRTHHPGCTI